MSKLAGGSAPSDFHICGESKLPTGAQEASLKCEKVATFTGEQERNYGWGLRDT